jgi:hypothetical protein
MNSLKRSVYSLVKNPLLDGLLVATLCIFISADVLAQKQAMQGGVQADINSHLIQVAFGSRVPAPVYPLI